MSFKREGDDKGLLDNLRRRRIKELLGEEIPEDEAKLLCNGRFACLVCGHNPVFDTVNMLMVHRQGKKHAASEAEYVRKKKELKALILRRKHEQYMKDGTTNIRQAAATSLGGVLSSQPYDPCVKKHKAKPYERKARLDLRSAPACSQSQPRPLSSHALSAAIPQKHSHQLKNIFRPSQTSEGPVTPYVRQHRTHTNGSSTSCQPVHSVQTVSSGDQSLSQMFGDSQHSESLSLTTSSSRSSFYKPSAASLRQNSCSSSASFGEPAGPQCSRESVRCAETSGQLSGSLCTADSSVGIQGKGAADGLSVSSHADSDAVGNPGADGAGSAHPADIAEKKVLAQKYYQISGSGWKKDWDGKWIRDEEAEFDSDEEPPDLP